MLLKIVLFISIFYIVRIAVVNILFYKILKSENNSK